MLKVSKPTRQRLIQGLVSTGEMTGVNALLRLAGRGLADSRQSWRWLVPKEPPVLKDRPELAVTWTLRQLSDQQRLLLRRRCRWLFYPVLAGTLVSLGVALNALVQGQALALAGALGAVGMGLALAVRASLVSAQVRYPPAGLPWQTWLRQPREWLPR